MVLSPPTSSQRGSGAPAAPPAPRTAFPSAEAAAHDDALLVTGQRPKDSSRLEYIKCLLKKDFMRLVTTKNNLNFNLQGRNLKKKEKEKDHKTLFAESYGFNIRLTF